MADREELYTEYWRALLEVLDRGGFARLQPELDELEEHCLRFPLTVTGCSLGVAVSKRFKWLQVYLILDAHLLRVYDLRAERVRLDTTTASLCVSAEGLFQLGHSKDHRPDLPQLKVMLATLDPDSPAIQVYQNGAFHDYQPQAERLPRASSSVDWYRGWRDHLEFAKIESVRE